MKLSEAIRAGAKIRPQARGRMYTERRRWFGLFGPLVRHESCAFGAAVEAANCGSHIAPQTNGVPFRGETPAEGTDTEIIDTPPEWSRITFHPSACPQCEKTDTVNRLIPHLNDDHKWSREEIALWVAKIEHEVEWIEANFMPTGAEASIPEAETIASSEVR